MKLKKDIECECSMARGNMNICKKYNDNEAKMFYQGMCVALDWVLQSRDGKNLNTDPEYLEELLKEYDTAHTVEMII